MSSSTRTESTERKAAGWGTVFVLALTVLVLSVLQPTLLIFVPFALLLLALPPRRPLLVAGAGLLLYYGLTGGSRDTLWYVERAWPLLLGAWFVVAVVVRPNWSFVSRAIAAVSATFATVAVPMVWSRSAFAQVDGAVTGRMRDEAAQLIAALRAGQPSFQRVAGEMGESLESVLSLQAMVYPALLGLGSLAALAVAWFAYRRIARQDPTPLHGLREFRFADDLVWLLIAGVLLLVLPLASGADRAGANLLTFMAGLYAVRGAAVLIGVGGVPGPLGVIVGGVVLVLLYPLVMVTMFVVGLTDTWLDIRSRRAALPPGS